MNGQKLADKLKWILRELGMNKKQFLEVCKLYSPSLSKPTILNAINGKNKTFPSIETLSIIIKVCQISNNEKIRYISYDFLLNDNIEEIEAKTSQVYQEIGLADDVINRLRQHNHPLLFNYSDIINYFFIHIPGAYFKYLGMLKRTIDIKNNINDTQKILKLFDDGWYLEYMARNFKNVYDLYIDLKNNKKTDVEKLNKLLDIMVTHFKFLLFDLSRKLYDNI